MATIRINPAQKINVHRPEAPARPGYLGARQSTRGRSKNRQRELHRAGEEERRDAEPRREPYRRPRGTWKPHYRAAVLVGSRVRRDEHPGRIRRDIARGPLSNTFLHRRPHESE